MPSPDSIWPCRIDETHLRIHWVPVVNSEAWAELIPGVKTFPVDERVTTPVMCTPCLPDRETGSMPAGVTTRIFLSIRRDSRRGEAVLKVSNRRKKLWPFKFEIFAQSLGFLWSKTFPFIKENNRFQITLHRWLDVSNKIKRYISRLGDLISQHCKKTMVFTFTSLKNWNELPRDAAWISSNQPCFSSMVKPQLSSHINNNIIARYKTLL